MSYVLTLVSPHNISDGHFAVIARYLQQWDIDQTGDKDWLAPDQAVDIAIASAPFDRDFQDLREDIHAKKADIFITSIDNRQKKLLLADMDSTIVSSETLDDLAVHAGIQNEIAAITRRAMRGELDFHEALRERVGLLKGLPEDAIKKTKNTITLNVGADILVQTMRKSGNVCVLVSGGFTVFTSDIAQKCGFHFHHGNILNMEDGALSGTVQNPILDQNAKLNFLKDYSKKQNLNMAQTLAIGDGANDLPMLQNAGLGIGYHPKPILSKNLVNVIEHCDLTAILYAQGYRKSDFWRRSPS